MANLPYKDIDGTTTKYVKATGVGTDGDPYVTQRVVTIADGGDVTQGTIADAVATTDGGSFSIVALIKRLLGKFPTTLGTKTSANSLGVVLASDQATLNVNLAQRLDATNDSINVGAVGGTLPDSTAVILASAARTATTASATITKPQLARGAVFLINSTAGVNATDTIQFTIEVQDPIGLSWRGIWTSAAVIASNGLTGYNVYPGTAAGSFSAIVAIQLPTNYRVRVVHATATSVTYSVSAVYCS